MPTYPTRYNSQATPTTQQPSAFTSLDKSGSAMSQGGQELGNTMANVGIKWANAIDTIQETSAQAKFKSGMLDIQSRASSDPDYNNSDQYYKEIEKLKNDSLGGFASNSAKSKTALDLDYQAQVGQIQVQNIYKKKIIDVGQASTLNLLDNESKIAGPDIEGRINNILAPQVASGVFSHKQAEVLSQKYTTEGKFNNFYSDMSASREEAGKNLDTNSYGFDAKELSQARTKLKQQVSKDNYMQRIERANLTHDLMDQANNGILAASTLEEAFLTKGISNSTYKSLQENANGNVGPTARTDPQTYYDLTHYLLREDADPDTAIQRILDANSQGKLSREDQKKLYSMHLTPSEEGNQSIQDMVNQKPQDDFDKMKAQYDDRIKSINDKRGWFKPAFTSFNENFTGPEKEKNVAEAQMKLVETIQKDNVKNEDIPKVADKIIGESNLKKHPEWASLPETGKEGVDRFGNRVLVYPDGRVVRKQ